MRGDAALKKSAERAEREAAAFSRGVGSVARMRLRGCCGGCGGWRGGGADAPLLLSSRSISITVAPRPRSSRDACSLAFVGAAREGSLASSS